MASKVSSRVITFVIDAMGIFSSAFFSYSTRPLSCSIRMAARQLRESAGAAAAGRAGSAHTACAEAVFASRRATRCSPIPCAVPKASANNQKQSTAAHSAAKFLRSILVPPPRSVSIALIAFYAKKEQQMLFPRREKSAIIGWFVLFFY